MIQNLDLLLRNDRYVNRLETDLRFGDLAALFTDPPLEMERPGLGIWLAFPVNVDDAGYMIVSVPRDDKDRLGTTVFYQDGEGMNDASIAGVLLQLLGRQTARFMTPDGEMVTPAFASIDPEIEDENGAQKKMH
ncbi:MAG: hypothetical protein AAGL89_09270 [Pseudomonadota bacterium]